MTILSNWISKIHIFRSKVLKPYIHYKSSKSLVKGRSIREGSRQLVKQDRVQKLAEKLYRFLRKLGEDPFSAIEGPFDRKNSCSPSEIELIHQLTELLIVGRSEDEQI